ncbi:MAG: hypothetical protein JNK05_34860 [Myxococcales bacterium]|nr:hypothetical protein [Myxococcales bacterium]
MTISKGEMTRALDALYSELFALRAEVARLKTDRRLARKLQPAGENAAVLETLVESIELPVRAANALQNARVVTLGDLVAFKRSELEQKKGFGSRTMRDIDELLSQYKLAFTPEDTP